MPKQDLSPAAQAKRVGTALRRLRVKAKNEDTGPTPHEVDVARDVALRAVEADAEAYDSVELAKAPTRGIEALCQRMQPGEWYTLPQLAALLPDYSKDSVKVWLGNRRDLFERKNNPNAAARGYLSVPVYLYGLSAAGEEISRIR